MEWAAYNFELFGLSCDIFRGGHVSVMLDPRTPNVGYLSQREGPLALTVSYGPDADLNAWVGRMLSDSSAGTSTLKERTASAICGLPAERVVFEVVTPQPAAGHRLEAGGVQALAPEPDGPFLLSVVGAVHRATPFMATFQRPSADDPSYGEAEEHFFASFRCRDVGEQ